MIRTIPDVEHTDLSKLCEAVHSYSKKHGQLKKAISRMIQLAMLFLQSPDTTDMQAPASFYAVLGKDSLQTALKDESMGDSAATESMAVDDGGNSKTSQGDKASGDKVEEDREGKEDDRITALLQHAKAIGDKSLDDAAKMKLMVRLLDLTDGKVFLSV